MSYLAFSLLFVAATLLPVAGAVLSRRTGRVWWQAVAVAMAALLVLTVVFDSLMVRVDLFRYDQSRALGIDVLLAPVEDLAWPVAAALLLPALWRLRRGARPPGSHRPRRRRVVRSRQTRRSRTPTPTARRPR